MFIYSGKCLRIIKFNQTNVIVSTDTKQQEQREHNKNELSLCVPSTKTHVQNNLYFSI